jgi:hypothetical protein
MNIWIPHQVRDDRVEGMQDDVGARELRDDKQKGLQEEAGLGNAENPARIRARSGTGRSTRDRGRWPSDQGARAAAQKGRVTRCLATPAP